MPKFFNKNKNSDESEATELTQESFDALQTELENATTALETANDEHATEIKNLNAQIETLTTEKQTLTDSNKKLTEDLAESKASEKEALESIEPKANALAIELISKAGHKQDIEPEGDSEDKKNKVDENASSHEKMAATFKIK